MAWRRLFIELACACARRPQVILSNGKGGATFPPTTNGGPESDITVVTIISDEGQKRLVDNIMALMNINRDRVKLGAGNYKEQFITARGDAFPCVLFVRVWVWVCVVGACVCVEFPGHVSRSATSELKPPHGALTQALMLPLISVPCTHAPAMSAGISCERR